MNQTTKRKILDELRFIERELILPITVRPENVKIVRERLNYIRKLLTDQPFNITAIPE